MRSIEPSLPNTQRYAMAFEYDGQAFSGWQIQSDADSVQAEVESALSVVANQPIKVVCSGRTDSGVHAFQQVVHFDTAKTRSSREWLLGCNSNLPMSVSALWVQAVDADFSARFSATSRAYRYSIMNRWLRPALNRHRFTWVRYPLDVTLMQQAAQYLLGEHDFSSFRAARCQAHHPVREVKAITVTRKKDRIDIDITANAFLYHMVRNIAGSLIRVGRSQQAPEWIAEVLTSRQREMAGTTAAPEGLVFIGPKYPKAYKFPELPLPAFPETNANSLK